MADYKLAASGIKTPPAHEWYSCAGGAL